MKRKINKFITGIALISMLVLNLSSCSKEETTPALTANLQYVNTVEGATAQDVYLNNSKVTRTPLTYGTATDYSVVPAGESLIEFKNTGTATTNVQLKVVATFRTAKSVYLIKQIDGSLGLSIFANEGTATNGKVKVRFINVAPLLTKTIDVNTSTGTAVISALAFKIPSTYQTIDIGTSLSVKVVDASETTAIASTEFQAGNVYTVWFDGATTTKVKYHILKEN